jgi:hypothetical protein
LERNELDSASFKASNQASIDEAKAMRAELNEQIATMRTAANETAAQLAATQAKLDSAALAITEASAAHNEAQTAANAVRDRISTQLQEARTERDDALAAKASAEALRGQALTDKASAEQSRDAALAEKAASDAAATAARRSASATDTSSNDAAESLALAATELRTIKAQKEDEAKAAAAITQGLKDQIEQLEAAAKTAGIAPATEASGGAKAAIMLQTIRTSFSQHKNRADDDDTEWKKKEVAIGNAIQQLLAMVQKSPDSRDMVYGLLNDLQGILDAGRKLVKRNRQFLEDKETVISELENQL